MRVEVLFYDLGENQYLMRNFPGNFKDNERKIKDYCAQTGFEIFSVRIYQEVEVYSWCCASKH